MKVTVYTKPNCVQCDQTKRMFDKGGVKYETKDITQSPEDLKRFMDMGLMSAPIVEAGKETWSGFKIEKIKDVIAETMLLKVHVPDTDDQIIMDGQT